MYGPLVDYRKTVDMGATMFTLDVAGNWVIVRNDTGQVTFRHNTGDLEAARAEFRECAKVLDIALAAKRGRPKKEKPEDNAPPDAAEIEAAAAQDATQDATEGQTDAQSSEG